ncbi:uncharacterized protein PV09_05297 [Verruconis gallopava]|uniref:Rho-GAP domain-containing protein n=1 Tax=Verruconis gallopava TaxID=253628 RepID=A0A0D1XM82_9PEZI|nr:uncharacterized protein PV09_05297 [Verruconis gallopava]KIW03536.1 hypothetical protein PV09_05297 [Verruconis gallopava]
MPSKVINRARFLFSRFRLTEHVPPIFNDNVHDLARIGGISTLALPNEYAPCDLVIPTRFAATAQFLVDACFQGDDLRMGNPTDRDIIYEDHGQQWKLKVLTTGAYVNVPGLFRIPGSKVTTERLRTYFERQMYDGGGNVEDIRRQSQNIEYTVRVATLPSQSVLPYQIHDVASCFKSFLGDLDGGVLGSLEIFEGLRKATLPRSRRKSLESASLEWKCIGLGLDDEHDDVDPKDIARILCSIECAAKRNLILAVFGLLAFFMVDDSPSVHPHEHKLHISSCEPAMDEMKNCCFPSAASPDAGMTAEALSRIFAPLMLGEELTKHIDIDFVAFPGSGDKRNHRRNSTPSPQKLKTPYLPKRTPVWRLRQGTYAGINKANITVNVHPCPSQSTLSYCDGSSTPSSRHSIKFAQYGGLRDRNLSAKSFIQAHANCSAQTFPAFTGGMKIKKTKKLKSSNPEFMLYEQQVRILLIANVITIVLWNWRDVCLELRALGYGRREGHWFVGESAVDTLDER